MRCPGLRGMPAKPRRAKCGQAMRWHAPPAGPHRAMACLSERCAARGAEPILDRPSSRCRRSEAMSMASLVLVRDALRTRAKRIRVTRCRRGDATSVPCVSWTSPPSRRRRCPVRAMPIPPSLAVPAVPSLATASLARGMPSPTLLALPGRGCVWPGALGCLRAPARWRRVLQACEDADGLLDVVHDGAHLGQLGIGGIEV
jgi:hypothetical protein